MNTRGALHLVEGKAIIEELTVDLETDDLASLQLAKRSLACKVLPDKGLNKGAIKSILTKAWGEPQ
ncbi:hypothetical protein SESBI_24264 [Sesbania bispinosa]|nr:hypothetical protein SESBI_24264 [Sesbania bispinosa]